MDNIRITAKQFYTMQQNKYKRIKKQSPEKMQEALDCFIIEGVQTNISFLSAVLENKKPGFPKIAISNYKLVNKNIEILLGKLVY